QCACFVLVGKTGAKILVSNCFHAGVLLRFAILVLAFCTISDVLCQSAITGAAPTASLWPSSFSLPVLPPSLTVSLAFLQLSWPAARPFSLLPVCLRAPVAGGAAGRLQAFRLPEA